MDGADHRSPDQRPTLVDPTPPPTEPLTLVVCEPDQLMLVAHALLIVGRKQIRA
jgi:hypothetical protein